MGIFSNVKKDLDLWEQKQEAKRKMNNETDPVKRAELQKDFEAKAKAHKDFATGKTTETADNNPEAKTDDKSTETVDKPTGKSDSVADKVTRGLSASFYRDLSANLRNKPAGNTLDAAARTAKAQGVNYKNRSADRQMEAQSSQQIANRNEYAEAGKIASMQNNAQNMQNNYNLPAAAGNVAFLQRKITAPDVQGQQARQDQQRNVANMQREKGNTAQEEATAAIGDSDNFKIKSRDYDQDMDISDRLSKGETIGAEEPEAGEEEVQQPEQQQTKENRPEEKTETPEESNQSVSGNPHHILNYVTYGDPKAMDDADRKLYEAWGSPQPLDEATIKAAKGNLGVLQQNVMNMRPDFWKKYAESDIGKARGIGTANQRNIGNGLTRDELDNATQTVEQQKPNNPPSDTRVKDLKTCLSDLHLKHIKEDFDSGIGISPENFAWLAKYLGGKFKHNDREYDFFNDDDWADDTDGSVLQGYAEHIRNYLYTYKPEATEIDSSIDPNQEHIGPMAQDIEQVNPACVKETPEGVKTVDTQRLSMMNAGAIGDLARMLSDISDRLTKAGI